MAPLAPMGGAGGIVEIDETYIGRKEGFEIKRGLVTRTRFLPLLSAMGKLAPSMSRTQPRQRLSRLFARTWRMKAT